MPGGCSEIAHQAQPAPADTFISVGWACPTATTKGCLDAFPGRKSPEKQLSATKFGCNEIPG